MPYLRGVCCGTLFALMLNMPRHARILPQSAMLHIIGRANNNVQLFQDSNDFQQFVATMLRYTQNEAFYIHHYTLMHTHFHLLAWVVDTTILSSLMLGVQLSYHHYYRKQYSYKGHLWHSRFRSIVIKDDAHWIQCGRYIELNPVHARLCNKPEDFTWSSYHYYAYGRYDPLVRAVRHERILIPKELNCENDHYQEFVLSGIDLDYHELKKRYERGRF